MVERDRLRLLAGLAATPFVTPTAARADDGALLRIMLRVLAGDLQGALDATRRLARNRAHPDAKALLVELADMARGDYATKGNRAFPRFAPLWRRARSEWLDGHRPPAGSLPAQVLSLPPAVASVIAVDLERNAAWLLRRGEAGIWSASGFYVSSGVGGAGKQRRGDRRTPVGVYWIADELETSRLPVRYGSRALALDYPNALDHRAGRDGGGIWIHGIDPANNVRPPRDTDGCVAVTEDRIDALADAVEPRATPVIIGSGLDWAAPPARPLPMAGALDAALGEWLASRNAGDADRFLSHYDAGFTRLGMQPALWRSWRRGAMASGAVAAVSAEDVAHFAADTAAGVFVTRFRQRLLRVAGDGAPVVSWQRLYWQQKEGRLRIVAQSAG